MRIFCFILLGLFQFSFPETPLSHQKKFVIVIPSYNNEKYVEKNLKSAIQQNYSNYQIVYIDDASKDSTYEIAKNIRDSDSTNRVKLIRNLENKGAPHNINHIVRQLEDDVIVCILDGDDWFSRNDVLEILNSYYSDSDIWLTYGSYMNLHNGKRGEYSKKIPEKWVREKSYRNNQWLTSHLRTFYAGLFKKIDENDLKMNGEFIRAAGDLAIMFPLLEMANGRFRYIEEILYVYNNLSPLNEFRIRPQFQLDEDSFIRAKQPYEKVDSIFN